MLILTATFKFLPGKIYVLQIQLKYPVQNFRWFEETITLAKTTLKQNVWDQKYTTL